MQAAASAAVEIGGNLNRGMAVGRSRVEKVDYLRAARKIDEFCVRRVLRTAQG
jgi:hypothetical protein